MSSICSEEEVSKLCVRDKADISLCDEVDSDRTSEDDDRWLLVTGSALAVGEDGGVKLEPIESVDVRLTSWDSMLGLVSREKDESLSLLGNREVDEVENSSLEENSDDVDSFDSWVVEEVSCIGVIGDSLNEESDVGGYEDVKTSDTLLVEKYVLAGVSFISAKGKTFSSKITWLLETTLPVEI